MTNKEWETITLLFVYFIVLPVSGFIGTWILFYIMFWLGSKLLGIM